MTANQINYWANQERERSNRANEAETNRSNLAREYETHRSNVTKEKETERNNRATLAETNRHNVVAENELNRANIAKETEDITSHRKNEELQAAKNNIAAWEATYGKGALGVQKGDLTTALMNHILISRDAAGHSAGSSGSVGGVVRPLSSLYDIFGGSRGSSSRPVSKPNITY